MKTAIIYKTIYGSTAKYAKWLSDSIACDVFEMDSFNEKLLKDYDRLIAMSGTYAFQMPLIGFLKKNWKAIESKSIVAVAVGAAPENSFLSKLSYFFIPGFIKNKIKYFKVPGPYKDRGELPKKEYLKKAIDFLKK